MTKKLVSFFLTSIILFLLMVVSISYSTTFILTKDSWIFIIALLAISIFIYHFIASNFVKILYSMSKNRIYNVPIMVNVIIIIGLLFTVFNISYFWYIMPLYNLKNICVGIFETLCSLYYYRYIIEPITWIENEYGEKSIFYKLFITSFYR